MHARSTRCGRSASASGSNTIRTSSPAGSSSASRSRALVNHPKLLLADEPTGNLDSRTSIEVMGIFQRLNEERGLTIVLVTHEADIAEYATRIVLCRDGRVLSDQPVARRRSAALEIQRLAQEAA